MKILHFIAGAVSTFVVIFACMLIWSIFESIWITIGAGILIYVMLYIELGSILL